MRGAVPQIALQAVTPTGLTERVGGITLAEARKIVAAVHRDEALDLTPPVGVRKAAVATVRAVGHVPRLTVVRTVASRVDPFVKVAVCRDDGDGDGRTHVFETVRIPLERAGRFSACVSSQVGCALACAFCATGKMGLVRNLETWEIVEQVRVLKRGLLAGGVSGRIHGVVFQGMGEPMANLDRVLEAISVFSDPSALAIDMRAMTVCTSGIPAGIRRLAREVPRVRLGLSIGSARRDVRRRLMPIEQRFALDEVLDAAAEHAKTTGLSPMWAVTPLAGENDTVDDARALADRALAFARATGVRPRISLIPYNAIADAGGAREPFARPDDATFARYADELRARGVGVHWRYSGGGDVRAACGQLAAGA
jgi:23S rRNA (adenine2503-C2)-methyltransferase